MDGQEADEPAEYLRPVFGGGVLDLGEEITDVVVLLHQQCRSVVVLAGVVAAGIPTSHGCRAPYRIAACHGGTRAGSQECRP
ncbi:hypothetical protein SUDANB176_07275 [Streptomyces sp. enrichment culture]|uniref:hypothetical protein n=1 Tax=Streptomyces sp. enrichment culture TaxID=1795815 RepID=UPI003F57342C